MHAVLDTNIVIDLLHFADPRARTLREAIDRGELTCFTDQPCLAELERVAAYPQFALDDDAREELLANYRHFVGVCEADGPEDYALPRCRDPDDQKFLVLAVRCRAELLITRDRGLLTLARQRRRPLPYAIVTAEAAGSLIASH
ncbi:putative toxin-antitoxin system toxin component, PIN family [Accumulibacter sp.]|jgi:putative PIN family toxin of toxin-antitoxin system|uniref:PilT protein domain protein n=1 Tax=Accumulibacter regalis TaxID=522306 RepID=C7RSM6_ACCRE|nr:putative toxin-antitoxin system toxin component, PIN family [Accumulibacter sp.]MBN8495549.1 putative toxin-antitoxin system toxin component, PIN family [Accumulibacter sp.]MBO3715912.1 putative toxin-antitoxin system toxin component, PIN family [Accumulibacter sp.]